VLAGVVLVVDPVDCATSPAVNTTASPARTAALKTMRSVAFMTLPPPLPGVPNDFMVAGGRSAQCHFAPASLDLLDVSICHFDSKWKGSFP
jgi:hypothetical protein